MLIQVRKYSIELNNKAVIHPIIVINTIIEIGLKNTLLKTEVGASI